VGAGDDDRAVGRDDLCLDEVVAGQPRDRHQPAEATTEREAADPRVAERAARNGQPMRECGRIDVIPERAAAGMGESPVGIDVHRTHRRERHDEGAVRKAVAGDAVSAAADGDRQPECSGRQDGRHDVVGRRARHDDGRPPVEHPVERQAGSVVSGMIGQDRARRVGGRTPGLVDLHRCPRLVR
jgi:hypothetical protein